MYSGVPSVEFVRLAPTAKLTLGQPEVGQSYMPFSVEQHVVWLQIPVDDS